MEGLSNGVNLTGHTGVYFDSMDQRMIFFDEDSKCVVDYKGSHYSLSWMDKYKLNLMFSKEQMREALKPKEGDYVFSWHKSYAEYLSPEYSVYRGAVMEWSKVRASAITIGLNVGELRRLVEWAYS